MGDVSDMGGFSLGKPALVCRWRLSSRSLPLQNRHLRALSQRHVDGKPVDANLVAWAKQHIEWTLGSGAAENPDGVLMLVIDEAGQAAMTVGPYEPLSDVSTHALVGRAALARIEAARTGVAPETLWLVHENELVAGLVPGEQRSGATSLVADLAVQVGLRVVQSEDVARPETWLRAPEGVFLVSDEHGVVVASDCPSVRAERFVGAYHRLLEEAGRR